MPRANRFPAVIWRVIIKVSSVGLAVLESGCMETGESVRSAVRAALHDIVPIVITMDGMGWCASPGG